MQEEFAQRRSNIWAVLIMLGASLFLLLSIAPGFHESFFAIDDNGLFNQSYLSHPWNLQALKVMWTPGHSADYYPLRDMSTWIDWSFAKDLASDTTVPKIQNFLWLVGISILLFFLLEAFIKNPILSALGAAAWLVHPFHLESIHWISARKDLMAWFFTLASTLSFLRLLRSQKMSAAFWVCFFFTCGLLSKATFLAVPFAAVFWFFLNTSFANKKISKMVVMTLIATCLLSLGFVAINYWNYTQSNFMQMTEETWIRYLSVLAALGRNVVGVFVPFFNAVDVEPWGGWYLYNKDFISAGVVALVALAGVTVYALIKKNSSLLLFAVLVGAVLVMTPGFNPKHRNYYSIRYFEPVFFLMCVWGFIALAKIQHARAIFAGVMIYVAILLGIDSANWESNFAIMGKAYRVSPQDPSVRTMLMYEYFNLDTWGRLDQEQTAKFEKIYELQKQECLIAENPNPRCLAFYPKINNFLKRFPSESAEAENKLREKALKDILQMKGQIFSQVAKAELAWSRFHYKLNQGEVDQEALRDYFAGHKTLTDDFTRVRYLVFQCLEKGSEESQNLTQQWEKDFILDRREVAEFISQIGFPEVRQRMQDCFKTQPGS